MKTIQIITHCYAAKIPDFAAMLAAQMSSLIFWQPHVDVLLTVCCNEDDALTMEAVGSFGTHPLPTVRIQPLLMPLRDLFRRAIGRNRAAKASTADVVWFTDADYIFGRGCLDYVAGVDFRDSNSIIPRKAWIHRRHTDGDSEIKRVTIGEVFEPDLSLFQSWHLRLAIGGMQIVKGDFARQGYLDQTKWQNPVVDTSRGFQDTWCDKKYRKTLGLPLPVDIPGCYRMRHSSSAFESAESRGVR